MTRGGTREGAGRPAKDPDDKARMAAYRLPPAVIEAIKTKAAEAGVSQASLIASAVEAYQPPGSL